MKKKPIDWLFPPARKKILSLLMGHPGARWHLRNIARQTGLALGTVRRELTGLGQAEIILVAKDGNRVYYQANRGSPLFPELSGLIQKTVGLADVLREALEPLAKKIDLAFVYGSQASGEMRASSDVDVLVVGEISFAEVAGALSKIQDRVSREVNPTVYPQKEFAEKLRTGHHFLKTVLASSKLFLIGDEHELEKLGK